MESESEERPRKIPRLSQDLAPDEVGSVAAAPHDGDGPHDLDGTHETEGTPETEGPHEPEATHETEGIHVEADDAAPNGDAHLPAPSEVVSVEAGNVDARETPLSKSQQKRLRKKAEWEAKREERKVIRKEKVQAKRERKREAKEQARAEGRIPTVDKPQTHVRADQLPVTLLLDCDFDDLMRDGERVSLASQLTRCYSDNKNARVRAHIAISSFTGKLRERFDTVLTSNYKSWRGVRTFETAFTHVAEKAQEWMADDQTNKLAGVFSKYADLDEAAKLKLKREGEVVYLTSEADDDLTELKPYSTYIIGGLVDKNREKGICYKRARQAGVRTARLPIGEYMEMQSRKVLATNHVNEIMIKWLDCGDWGEAFMQVIPKRKGGKLRGDSS